MSRQLQPLPTASEQLKRLQADLRVAGHALAEAEAELSREQAAINRFRMHCRLKIGRWVDDVLDLRSEKQAALARLQLLRQADEMGIPFDETDPFWQAEAEEIKLPPIDDGLLLPTDTPRDKAAEKRLFRQLVRRFHPDAAPLGVDRAYATNMMVAVNHAYERGDIDTLRDLAGELDPAEAADLAQIDTPQARALQRKVLELKRRRRKVLQTHHALRQEDTAVLWRKAQRSEADGERWWEAVRVELQQAIDAMRADVAALTVEIERLSAAQSERVKP